MAVEIPVCGGGGGTEGGNLQADSLLVWISPSHSGLRLMTHEITTGAETKSWMLNRLSHPSTPKTHSFEMKGNMVSD